MEHSYRFFENKSCNYFPCHEGLKELNCMFCYCPLYCMESCPGNPRYLAVNGNSVKECSHCTFPHQPENYEVIIQILGKI